jgi:hypothetical protein
VGGGSRDRGNVAEEGNTHARVGDSGEKRDKRGLPGREADGPSRQLTRQRLAIRSHLDMMAD